MDPIQLSTRDAILLAAAVNAAIGLVLGLIPLLFGYFSKNLRIGLIAVAVTVIGGALLGVIVSIPATIIFTYIIFHRSRGRKGLPTDDR
ncbi:MAG: hypothetical protein KF736_04830 [Acidobacteria bacterium]|nr:hypothetical protein [Acidobacteriota bacterium]MCW5948291.1 hypothetical protein [Pyrinomonadaceae bacterium]